MKLSLIVYSGSQLDADLVAYMKMLGYFTVATNITNRAVQIVKAVKFDVILLCKLRHPPERRSLASELKTLSRNSIIILVTSCPKTYRKAKSCHISGLTAVLRTPINVNALWRVLEYGQEGLGCHPGWVDACDERRKT
jgi:hypothetical protein